MAQKGVAAIRRLAAPEVDVFDIGERLSIGRYTYGKPQVRWYEGDAASVRIGAFCSIADDVGVTIGGGHPLDWPSMYPFRAFGPSSNFPGRTPMVSLSGKATS